MRQVLLAATATIALSAGAAFAQAPTDTPYLIGGKAAGFQFGPASATPSPDSDPGTIQAYLRTRLYFFAGLSNDSYLNTGAAKNAAYGFGEFARIYPSFEGTAANGLKYGAYLEVRQNSNGTSFGGGSSNTTGNTLFWRRETGYVGGSFGQVRFGQTDGPLNLFLTGTFENFDIGGGWNGEFPNGFNVAGTYPGGTTPVWPFGNSGGTYSRLKVMYLSPQLANFDFGVSFQPNDATSGEPSPVAGSGSSTLTSLSSGAFAPAPAAPGGGQQNSQLRRSVNEVTGVARFRAAFGPIGVTATAGASTAGTVHDGGLTGGAADGGPKYSFISPTYVDSGLLLTYGKFAVGGHVEYGTIQPDGTTVAVPLASGHGHTLAWIVGTSYATGPVIVGGSFYSLGSGGANSRDYSGGTSGFGRRNEFGLAVGGTYFYTKGAALGLTYLYGQRHQYNYNFLADTRGTANNNTHVTGVLLENQFTW